MRLNVRYEFMLVSRGQSIFLTKPPFFFFKSNFNLFSGINVGSRSLNTGYTLKVSWPLRVSLESLKWDYSQKSVRVNNGPTWYGAPSLEISLLTVTEAHAAQPHTSEHSFVRTELWWHQTGVLSYSTKIRSVWMHQTLQIWHCNNFRPGSTVNPINLIIALSIHVACRFFVTKFVLSGSCKSMCIDCWAVFSSHDAFSIFCMFPDRELFQPFVRWSV